MHPPPPRSCSVPAVLAREPAADADGAHQSEPAPGPHTSGARRPACAGPETHPRALVGVRLGPSNVGDSCRSACSHLPILTLLQRDAQHGGFGVEEAVVRLLLCDFNPRRERGRGLCTVQLYSMSQHLQRRVLRPNCGPHLHRNRDITRLSDNKAFHPASSPCVHRHGARKRTDTAPSGSTSSTRESLSTPTVNNRPRTRASYTFHTPLPGRVSK
jgi:hypothetical protein